MKIVLKIAVVLAIVLGGVGGIGYLALTKTVVTPEEPTERVWPVAVAQTSFEAVRPELLLYGQVVAGREVEVSAQVAGEVQSVSEVFVDGGVVRAGDLLVQIDPFDYRTALAERRAQLDEAMAELKALREVAAKGAT